MHRSQSCGLSALSISVCRSFAADLAIIDIAGVPGTGKTATVHAVVKELKRKAEDGVSVPLHPWRRGSQHAVAAC